METARFERGRVTLPPAWKQLGLRGGERESNTTSCKETARFEREREGNTTSCMETARFEGGERE